MAGSAPAATKAQQVPSTQWVGLDAGQPLAFAQQWLWFFDRLMPGCAAYNVPWAFRLTGRLDASLLERSVREVIRRHEALRTAIIANGGRPYQVIVPDPPFRLMLCDLTRIPADRRGEEAARRMAEAAARPIDLGHGSLVRADLWRLGPEEHLLLFTIHHIACDGWSLSVLFREIATLYAAFGRGETSPLPELPLQYVDYAIRQRREVQGEALGEQVAYWRERLDGLHPLELPTNRPRPAVQAYRGARRALRLPLELADKVRALGAAEGATLYMTMMAAFLALLHRYSGQDDIAVGSPIAGRPRRELHPLIGCFINMIVLRTDISGDPPFRELLRRARGSALGAFKHQELPFGRLVEELRPAREPGRQPLFDVMFDFYKAPTWRPSLPEVEIAPYWVDNGTSKYDLTLTVIEDEAGLTCDMEFDSALYDPATAVRMLAHFRNLLEAAVAVPEMRVSQLPMLSEAECHQALVAWNNTSRTDGPRDRCVHALFEDQAKRTPNAVAVSDGDSVLTYAELNQRAQRLARRLRALGVGPESLVGLCLGRSVELVVGLLGILKSGGAYVPLDPAQPKGRLALMVDDGRIPVVVTEPALADSIAAFGMQIVFTDADELGNEAHQAGDGAASPANLAYVIFTSGSTGKPKGVQVGHRALTNFLLAMRSRFEMTERDALLAITSLSFDIAGLELYLPLIQGARVELANRDEALDGSRLARRLRDSGARFLQATPATWRLLLDGGWTGAPGLTMLCGGEPLPRDLSDRLLDKGAALWNLYGPTETTIWSAAGRVLPGDPITIGRPIDNTQLYVLDSHLQPVPVGAVGELYIGGAGLARGYLNKPGLTAERFVGDPFSTTPGARMYRTGDRARYCDDGRIECLGRMDDQVKIRGFRIELGDVEAALRRYPGVHQAAVVVRDGPGGDKRLIAYVASHSGRAEPRALREFLREWLPAYMLPSSFVPLDALPLTIGGKIDRRALPAPREAPPSPEREDAAAPRTAVERAIADAYRHVLGVQQVLLHDSLIDLGGHSLQTIEIIALLEARVGLRPNPRDLLLQTVGQLAADCERMLARTHVARGRTVRFVRRVLGALRASALSGLGSSKRGA
jgi:amino acid adenylation domain-containing protein